jgi:hypothetical protein
MNDRDRKGHVLAPKDSFPPKLLIRRDVFPFRARPFPHWSLLWFRLVANAGERLRTPIVEEMNDPRRNLPRQRGRPTRSC